MSQYPMEFQQSYGTMIIELQKPTRAMARSPVELWFDGHRVAVVYERYATISNEAMAQWSETCSSLCEMWRVFQWSYGTMIINFRWLEDSYCTMKFILKYKLSLMNTILFATHLVQLNLPDGNSTKPKSLPSPNRNSTLQSQIHFLRQTYRNRPLEPYRQFYPRCRPFHCKLVSTGHMTSGVLPYLTDNHYSESSRCCSASRAANFSFILPRLSLHAGNAVGFGRPIR